MPESPPYFPFYVNDFASDGKVEAMSTEGVGAYILLLCKAWRESPPGSIPNDDTVLARWARLDPERWAECRSAVLAAFTLGTDGRWQQKRMRSEYRKLIEYRALRAKAGRKGAESRWHPHGEAMQEPLARNEGEGESGEGEREGKPKPRTPRDELWDALCTAFDLRPVSKASRAHVGAMVTQLVAYAATPEEIPDRIRRYRKAWPAMTCTATAMVKHWAEFAPRKAAMRHPSSKTMDELAAERRAAADAEVLAERSKSPTPHRAPACETQEQRT